MFVIIVRGVYDTSGVEGRMQSRSVYGEKAKENIVILEYPHAWKPAPNENYSRSAISSCYVAVCECYYEMARSLCTTIYNAFDIIKQKTQKDPVMVFDLQLKISLPWLRSADVALVGVIIRFYPVKGDRQCAC